MSLPLPISVPLRKFAIASTVIILVIIAVLSLMESADLPPVSGSDKIKHVIAYAALAAPLTVWLGPKRWVWAIGLAALFGGCIEVAQWLAPTGRSGSLLDEAANAIGALMGAGAAKLLFSDA